jgi:DNA-directed RNA polymerase subunit N (RpoN/RPB10)
MNGTAKNWNFVKDLSTKSMTKYKKMDTRRNNMTREKKELLKQLQEIDFAEYCDNRMDGSGECGCMIAEHYDKFRQPIYERLNELMHGRLNDYFQACVI